MTYEANPPEWSSSEQDEYDSLMNDIDYNDLSSVLGAIEDYLNEDDKVCFCELVANEKYTEAEVKRMCDLFQWSKEEAEELWSEKFYGYKKEEWNVIKMYAFAIREEKRWAFSLYCAFEKRFDSYCENQVNNKGE